MRRKSALLVTGFAFTFIALAFADTNRDFHDQDLRDRDFTGDVLNGANFKDAIVARAKFINTSLKKATFKGADMTGALFKGADLTGADMTDTRGQIKCDSANLEGANLVSVDFGKVVTSSFKKANLQGASFGDSCTKDDFAGADLRNANFRGALGLSNNRFNGALYDDDTAWPTDFDPEGHYMVHVTREQEKAADDAAKQDAPK